MADSNKTHIRFLKGKFNKLPKANAAATEALYLTDDTNELFYSDTSGNLHKLNKALIKCFIGEDDNKVLSFTNNDFVRFVPGDNITIETDTVNNKITIKSKDTTYSAAGDTLGLIKSGGNLTIKNGVASISNYDHTHDFSDIIGLSDALDGKANTSHNHIISDVAELSDKLQKIDLDISKKASTSHDHTSSDITDLQSLLDGKSDTTHNHDTSYLKLSGGSISGALTVDNTSAKDHGFIIKKGTSDDNKVTHSIDTDNGYNIQADKSSGAESQIKFNMKLSGASASQSSITFKNSGNKSSITADNFNGSFKGNLTGDVKGNVTGKLTGDITGNSATANSLKKQVTITADLAKTSSDAFNGQTNVDIAVKGTLPVKNGGTGRQTINEFMNDLGIPGINDKIATNVSSISDISTKISNIEKNGVEKANTAESSQTSDTLKTPRTLMTHLDQNLGASFNGQKDADIGVTGILPVTSGGTGVDQEDALTNKLKTSLGITSLDSRITSNTTKIGLLDTETQNLSDGLTKLEETVNNHPHVTYTLSKKGDLIQLTGSDGSNSSVTDNDTDTVYKHPQYTAHELGLYKIKVDTLGHTENATAVTKEDIESLGFRPYTSVSKQYSSWLDFITKVNAQKQDPSHKDNNKVGDGILIVKNDVPDGWISKINQAFVDIDTSKLDDTFDPFQDNKNSVDIGYFTISKLETEKIDLSPYATKEELDCKLNKSGGEVTGVINMSNNKITNLGKATSNTDAVNYEQFNTAINAINQPFNFKGSVTKYSQLPQSGNRDNDAYKVLESETVNGELKEGGYYYTWAHLNWWSNEGTWTKRSKYLDPEEFISKDSIRDTTGQNTNLVMSQKGITDALQNCLTNTDTFIFDCGTSTTQI